MAQRVKNLPAMWETQVQSLCQEDPLEKGMATHSSILAWRIPWIEEPGRLNSPWGPKESGMTERLTQPTPTQVLINRCWIIAYMNEWTNVIHVILSNCDYSVDFYNLTGKNEYCKLNRKLLNHPVFSFSSQNVFPNKIDEMPHNPTLTLLWQPPHR